jgi:hypothetical protein
MRNTLTGSSFVHPLGKLNSRAEVIVWNESCEPGYTADLGCCRGMLFAGIAEVLLIACGILLWNTGTL